MNFESSAPVGTCGPGRAACSGSSYRLLEEIPKYFEARE